MALGQEVQWRADRVQRLIFPYAQVCQAMGVQDAPLITPAGHQLQCMSTKVNLSEFCLSQKAKKPFLRAVVLAQHREVACEYGMRGILDVSCRHADCHHPQEQCQGLKKGYAAQLDLIHSGVWAKGDLVQEDVAAHVLPELSIFSFDQLKLECIYEARASFWEHDDGRL